MLDINSIQNTSYLHLIKNKLNIDHCSKEKLKGLVAHNRAFHCYRYLLVSHVTIVISTKNPRDISIRGIFLEWSER